MEIMPRTNAGDISECHDDHSKTVIMLANQLIIMTGLDAVRVKRMLYQTGLVNEKWEEKRGNSTSIEYQIHDALRYVETRANRGQISQRLTSSPRSGSL